jgi:peptide-methionine (S)-S-oxide reductase
MMINRLLRSVALLGLVSTSAFASTPGARIPVAPPALDTVVFAGGCFWGVQAVFQHVNGVVTATSGYAGGKVTHPSYEDVSTGATGHAESVRVVYDPAKVSFGKLLDVFFTVAHDPTQLNRQGPDRGPQYRSALFYTSEGQKAATLAYIAQLVKRGEKVVTQVAPLSGFYPAEAYHQDYATLHPNEPYIYYNDAPKVAALKKQYASLWTDRLAGH